MLHHPCILGGPQQREQNQKSKPTPGVTMTPLGAPSIPKYGSLVRPDAQIATAKERGGGIRIGPLVGKDGARWPYNPCRLGDPHRLRAGGRIIKEPTRRQGGYITQLGAFGARWLLGPIPLTTNCRPEAPEGGGLVGVLGPAESPPPYPPPTCPTYLLPPTSPPYLPPLPAPYLPPLTPPYLRPLPPPYLLPLPPPPLPYLQSRGGDFVRYMMVHNVPGQRSKP